MGNLVFYFSVFEDFSETGLYVDRPCNCYLKNSIFERCLCNSNGGGIYMSKCNSNLTGVCFTECKGTYGSSIMSFSNGNHQFFQISCLRSYVEKTTGDSMNLGDGIYKIQYLNSSYSISSEASVLQWERSLESNVNFLLGINTQGTSLIEMYNVYNPITFMNSVLANSTASYANILLDNFYSKAYFKKIIFCGNNQNLNTKCFSNTENAYFEECSYLDEGPFGTNTLPSGIQTKETEINFGGKFAAKWCLEMKNEQSSSKNCIFTLFLNFFSIVSLKQ